MDGETGVILSAGMENDANYWKESNPEGTKLHYWQSEWLHSPQV